MKVEPGIDIIILFHIIVSSKRDLSHVFSRSIFLLYARSLKCPLHIASYALRSEYPSSSCEALNFSLAIHQRKCYISIARTGNFIMYTLGPFLRKRSHMHICM